MFIGHYAPALALAPSARRVPLWALFVAVQLLDFGWDAFVLVGLEHLRLTPGFTASNDLDLYDMPLTHSLAAAIVWALVAGAVTLRLAQGSGAERRWAAGVVALAVGSHWLLDLIVHVHDLSLAGGSTPRVGLGLWNHPVAEVALEVGTVLAAGAWAAYRARRDEASDARARRLLMFSIVLAAVALVERVVPPATSTTQLVAMAFVSYVVLALAAWRVERGVGAGAAAA
jgi:hypothetical protein